MWKNSPSRNVGESFEKFVDQDPEVTSLGKSYTKIRSVVITRQTDRQTDRQTETETQKSDKRRVKHNLIGGGKSYVSE